MNVCKNTKKAALQMSGSIVRGAAGRAEGAMERGYANASWREEPLREARAGDALKAACLI